MDLLDHVISATNEYIERMPKALRKSYGQFFTSRETAAFMAQLFNIPTGKETLRILDAGAGTGILSVALVDCLQKAQGIQSIRLVCYETDTNIIEILKENLIWAQKHSAISLNYEIRTDNYILSQYLEYNSMLGANPHPEEFDLIIGNPPYMKLPRNAPEATAMPDVCYGAPNMYFLFATMGMFNLVNGGEMVYIIPRSWTSGAYFKRFRQKFLSEGVLEHIHLFVSRDKVFDKESVLQETIIIKVKKTTDTPANIHITTTHSNSDFTNLITFDAPYEVVVSGPDKYVYLVTNSTEAEILSRLNMWHDTLPDLGLPMKTGLTVDFRNREALRNSDEDHAVPLFYSQHIQNGKVVFPIGKESEYIVTNQPGLLQSNENYLFVKRFTAKEERRRLQCGVYLSKTQPKYLQISTQNKINFIGGLRGASECIIYGLYVLFNSSIYDCYYRILNGSTQVNSTEINSMPVPPIDIIEDMGRELIKTHNMSEDICDMILRRYIYGEDRRSQINFARVASAS